MQETAWPAPDSSALAARPGRARVRRLLLEQLRQALASEPAALEAAPEMSGQGLTNIRARISIAIGTIVVRLNRERFTGSERLYLIRDELASGRPVEPADLAWLDCAITLENGSASGAKALEERPAR